MKMNRMLILMFLMGTIYCNAQTGRVDTAPHRVEIVESQSGQTVDVHKGDDVVVTFVASSGTGYQWTMEPAALATAKEEDVPQQPGLPGGPVKMMFHVQAKKTVTLHFKFSRAWEKTTPPTKTFSVTLNVSE
jgi:predicted secreted protein